MAICLWGPQEASSSGHGQPPGGAGGAWLPGHRRGDSVGNDIPHCFPPDAPSLPQISRAACDSPSWELSRDTPPLGRACSVTACEGALSLFVSLCLFSLSLHFSLSLSLS